MLNTSLLNLPYPEPTDPPDGAAQIKALAEAIGTAITLEVLDKPSSWAGWSGSASFHRLQIGQTALVILHMNFYRPDGETSVTGGTFKPLDDGSIPANFRPKNAQVDIAGTASRSAYASTVEQAVRYRITSQGAIQLNSTVANVQWLLGDGVYEVNPT